MATNPEDREINPSAIQKVVKAIQSPVVSKRSRTGLLLAFAGLLVALAPVPWGPIGVAVIVYIAADRSPW